MCGLLIALKSPFTLLEKGTTSVLGVSVVKDVLHPTEKHIVFSFRNNCSTFLHFSYILDLINKFLLFSLYSVNITEGSFFCPLPSPFKNHTYVINEHRSQVEFQFSLTILVIIRILLLISAGIILL